MDLEASLARLLLEHDVPGAVMGVLDANGDARVSFAGTRGQDRGYVDNDTIFAAASLTKPVFATGVMSLADDGVIDLDRPLSEYSAEPYLAEDERAKAITARMVLSHTTGFPNWRDDEPLYLRWAPGTRFGYSGEGYAYLQHVVERLTGTTISQFMTDAVFRPLGMRDSFLECGDDDAPRVALGHDPLGRAQPLTRDWGVKAAAGALFTTAADYLRFLDTSLRENHHMFTPQARIDDELDWGLGWGIEHGSEADAIWQWGDNPGYKGFVIGRPSDGRGVVVFTNGDRGARVYRDLVRELLPGTHPSLEIAHRPSWLLATAIKPNVLTPLDDDGVVVLGLVVQQSWQVQGIEPGTPVATLGLNRVGDDAATITSLEVSPWFRGHGLARTLLFGAASELHLRLLTADAESEAGDFFRALGFAVDENLHCHLELPSNS